MDGRVGRLTLVRAGVVAVLVGLLACGGGAEGWTPVLEGTPPTFLEEELGRALAEVRTAREALEAEPEAESAVSSSLESAAGRLDDLVTIYLPLYRSKVTAANAYRHLELGDETQARRGIDEVEERVLAISESTGGRLEAELEGILELVADARVALEAGSAAAGHLERLAEALDNLLTRAGLYM